MSSLEGPTFVSVCHDTMNDNDPYYPVWALMEVWGQLIRLRQGTRTNGVRHIVTSEMILWIHPLPSCLSELPMTKRSA
jgi:hypothetical protein